MADKMMRIAGRSELGKAKPFKVTEDGDLIISPNDRSSNETLQDSRDTISTGKIMDVSGRRSAIINVTGEFVAEIGLFVQFEKGSGLRKYPHVVDAISGKKLDDGTIRKKGIYVADISGFSGLATRVEKIDSGNVTTMVEAVTTPNAIVENAKQFKVEVAELKNKARNIPIFIGEQEVLADELKGITAVDITDYVMVYVVVRVDTPHDAEVSFSFVGPKNDEGFNTALPPLKVISLTKEESEVRYGSEWVEVKGARLLLNIKNNSDISQNYQIVLYGVR